MSADPPKAGLEPLRRLLENSRQGGGEAKVDALIALSQRTLFVATWEPETAAFRTLENARNETALPVFTGVDVFPEARARFGWPDRTIVREIGARQAFRHVVDHDLTLLLVDVGTEHAFEASPVELRPLVAASARQSGSGPFASVGRTSSQLLEAVRMSEHPAPGSGRSSSPSVPPPRLDSLKPHAGDSRKSPPGIRPPAPPGGDELTLEAMDEAPDEALLEALADALSGFLEVEWAAFCMAARGPYPARQAVALRLDPYRDRLGEIVEALRTVGLRFGVVIDVVLADTPHLVKLVRERGVLFHPWRERARR